MIWLRARTLARIRGSRSAAARAITALALFAAIGAYSALASTPRSVARAQVEAAPNEALRAAVRRFVGAHADLDACREVSRVGRERRWECTVTECPGACQVVHRIVVLGARGARFRAVSERREHRGDTGECGCCIDVF